jgi:hypothetical protein
MRFLQPQEMQSRTLQDRLYPLLYHDDAVTSPFCGRRADSGTSRQDNAPRPFCRVRNRDRLPWLFFQRHPELFPAAGRALLYIAPEPAQERWLRERCGTGYLSVDISRSDDYLDSLRAPAFAGGVRFCRKLQTPGRDG